MSALLEISDAKFDSEVLKSDVPVLVDFWAPWCGPCRAMTPVLEDLAARYGGKLKIVKINVDENPTVAGRFRIQSTPTLVLVKGGSVVQQMIGLQPKENLEKAISGLV